VRSIFFLNARVQHQTPASMPAPQNVNKTGSASGTSLINVERSKEPIPATEKK